MFPKVRSRPEESTSWAEVNRWRTRKYPLSKPGQCSSRQWHQKYYSPHSCDLKETFLRFLFCADKLPPPQHHNWEYGLGGYITCVIRLYVNIQTQKCVHVKQMITGKKPHRAFQFLKVTHTMSFRYLGASVWLEGVLVTWGQAYIFLFIRLLWIYLRDSITL